MKNNTFIGIIGTLASAGRNDLVEVLAENNVHNEIDSLINNFNSKEVGMSLQNVIRNYLGIKINMHYDGDDQTGVWWMNKDSKGFNYLQIKVSRLNVNLEGVVTVTVTIFRNGQQLGFIEEKKCKALSDCIRFLSEILTNAKSYIAEQNLTLQPDGSLA